MVKIYTKPEELWDFFCTNQKLLEEEMLAVAENTYTGNILYITERDELPMLVVCHNEEEMPDYEEQIWFEEDCESVMSSIIAEYIVPGNERDDYYSDLYEDFYEEEETERMMFEDRMVERDDDLYYAFYRFLETVLETEDTLVDIEDVIETVDIDSMLDGVLFYLAEEEGLDIYRPTIYKDESGSTVFTEYPYGDHINKEGDLGDKK